MHILEYLFVLFLSKILQGEKLLQAGILTVVRNEAMKVV